MFGSNIAYSITPFGRQVSDVSVVAWNVMETVATTAIAWTSCNPFLSIIYVWLGLIISFHASKVDIWTNIYEER